MIGRLLVAIAALALCACSSRIPPDARYVDRAESATISGDAVSAGRWEQVTLPMRRASPAGPLWLRIRFDAAPFGNRRLALFNDRIRERHTVYLNGIDIARSNAGASDRSFGWHRPLFVALPDRLLRARGNILAFRVVADGGRAVAFSPLTIGPDRELRALYRTRHFVTVAAPEIATAVIALLSIGALLFWLMRPREPVFGWLALLGVTWCFWNLQYFIDSVPFDDGLFWLLNADALFALTWAAFGFAATFLDIPHRRRFLIQSAVVCMIAIAFRHLAIVLGWSTLPSFLLVFPLALATIWVLGAACWRQPRIENFLMLGAVIASTVFGFHDLALVGAG